MSKSAMRRDLWGCLANQVLRLASLRDFHETHKHEILDKGHQGPAEKKFSGETGDTKDTMIKMRKNVRH
jgi:hypothetical protein